jgi:hypothetical protein
VGRWGLISWIVFGLALLGVKAMLDVLNLKGAVVTLDALE